MPKSILLVEDNEALLVALSYSLSDAGYSVVEARDGNIALEILKDKTFNLIITDLVMPNKNGLEFLQELAKLKIKTPAIVVSNVSSYEHKKIAWDLGIVNYFIKVETPIKDIVEYVQKFLGDPNGK